ncbi:hypothetical protein SNEBB_000060 [Seison nebaliae]|nr:hypothetical protein SNEBB_000060 [Seison nebaliae]
MTEDKSEEKELVPKYRFHYFNCRTPGEYIRYMFAYADVPFEDVRHSFADKQGIREVAPFNKLPVLEIDGKHFIPQTFAIGRYLAKQFNLHGSNPLESARIDEICEQIADIVSEYHRYSAYACHNGGTEGLAELRHNLNTVILPKQLKPLENIVRKNGKGYFIGNKFTAADFLFASLIDMLYFGGFDDVCHEYPYLMLIVVRIEKHPRIKMWTAKRPVTQL